MWKSAVTLASSSLSSGSRLSRLIKVAAGKMSGGFIESPSSCDSETADLSPEIPPLPPPLSRLEFSKVNRKKLNFEEVGQLLDSPTGNEHKSSKGKVSDKGAGAGTSGKVLPSQTSKLNVIARGYNNASSKNKAKGAPKTSTQPSLSTSGAKHTSASGRVPSKTPPAIRRHSETMTPRICPRPLTSLSNPEHRKGSTSRISKESVKAATSGEQKTPEGTRPSLEKQTSTTGESRKRPAVGHGSSPLSERSSSDSEPPTKRNSIESQLTEILREVQKANTRLDSYDDKLDSLQERLQKLEEKPTSSSISSSDASVTKRKVPPEVRHLVRDVYKTLLDDSEADFEGFDVKKRYTDPINQAVVKKVISETRSLDPTVCAFNVKDAIRRFFQSKLEEKSLKDKGAYVAKVQKQRRRNRLVEKLNDRKAILEGLSDEERKAKYKEVIILSFMSSEESGDELDENEDPKPVLYVHSLPWRSAKVNKLFSVLDSQIEKGKSKRALSQMYTRVVGDVSDRPKPPDFPADFWGFNCK